jgi:hypothetical protein
MQVTSKTKLLLDPEDVGNIFLYVPGSRQAAQYYSEKPVHFMGSSVKTSEPTQFASHVIPVNWQHLEVYWCPDVPLLASV